MAHLVERRKPMRPPAREVPPAVVQAVVEFKALMQDVRTHFGLDRRGKDIQHEGRAGEHR